MRGAIRSLALLIVPAAALLWAGAAVLMGPISAKAHRLNAAQTTVDVNPRNGALEVVHEVFIHDLEEAFVRRFGRALILSEGGQDVALAVALVTDAFTLRARSGDPVPLSLVGAERNFDRLVIYRDAASPPALKDLLIADEILMETFPAQTNRVNVRHGGRVRTLVFDGSTMGQAQPALIESAAE
ncbi:MAG: DUF6702 family protein [Alphaproteobacteria bacterium]